MPSLLSKCRRDDPFTSHGIHVQSKISLLGKSEVRKGTRCKHMPTHLAIGQDVSTGTVPAHLHIGEDETLAKSVD